MAGFFLPEIKKSVRVLPPATAGSVMDKTPMSVVTHEDLENALKALKALETAHDPFSPTTKALFGAVFLVFVGIFGWALVQIVELDQEQARIATRMDNLTDRVGEHLSLPHVGQVANTALAVEVKTLRREMSELRATMNRTAVVLARFEERLESMDRASQRTRRNADNE